MREHEKIPYDSFANKPIGVKECVFQAKAKVWTDGSFSGSGAIP